MTTFESDEAAVRFPALVARVAAGEEVRIARAGVVVARIVPLRTPQRPARTTRPRVPDVYRGRIVIADDFDAPRSFTPE